MVAEALILFACATSKGCSETTSQYATEHPEVRKQLDQDAKKLTKWIGNETVNTLGPALFFITGGTSNIKIRDSFYLQVNKNQGMIMLKKEFK